MKLTIEKNEAISNKDKTSFYCDYNGFIFNICAEHRKLISGEITEFSIAYDVNCKIIWSEHKHPSFIKMIELLDNYLINTEEKENDDISY